MTATLDRLSNGRLLINVVTGGDPVENGGDGIFLSHAERYEVTREFLEIYKRVLSGETVEFTGKHFRIEDGRLLFPPVQTPYPPLYFGGSSEAANAVAAEQIDKYLTWGEPPADVKAKLDGVRALAEKAGREVSFGIRLHVIVRETAEEAWAAAERLISRLDDATIAAAQKVFARMDSVGQSRMSRLHQGRRDKLEVSPNLWAGVGLVRGGAGTALVGDPDTVAERIDEYRRIGIDTFILSGYPHLEEAYSFGELVLPLPAARPPAARTRSTAVNMGPFGETVAGDHRPQADRLASRPASHEDGAAPPPPGRRHPRRRPDRRRDRLPPRARATAPTSVDIVGRRAARRARPRPRLFDHRAGAPDQRARVEDDADQRRLRPLHGLARRRAPRALPRHR